MNQDGQFLHLVVVNPETTIFEDDVVHVIAPGKGQELAILPDHTPLYANLIKGDIKTVTRKNKEQVIPIESGVMRVKKNQVSIIVGI